MLAMADIIAEEKGISKDNVLEAIETAIAAGWRKDYGTKDMTVRAELDTVKGTAEIIVSREVIEEGLAYDPACEVPQDQAEGKEVGEIVEERIPFPETLERVGAMTAKQVLISRLREFENDAILADFEDRIGQIVKAKVAKVERNIVRLDVGRATGIMPRSEMIPGERYDASINGDIKVLVKGIERKETRSTLLFSRADGKFVEELFRQEVPELETGAVKIHGVAREAGQRTKIAVEATMPGIDPVGTLVGGRGIRIQTIMREIGGAEKIDVVTWSENPSEFIREALSPAEIIKVEIEDKTATVYVTEEQQSVAIGRRGQNVRLASELTGYEINLEVAKPQEKKKKVNAEDGLLSAIADADEESEEE